MEITGFEIVFEKLSQVTSEEEYLVEVDVPQAELDEIAELRRLVLDLTDPDYESYTTT